MEQSCWHHHCYECTICDGLSTGVGTARAVEYIGTAGVAKHIRMEEVAEHIGMVRVTMHIGMANGQAVMLVPLGITSTPFMTA